MGAYNRADFDNPEVYSSTLVALLRDFPDRVIERVTDPGRGIQTECSYPPRPAELRNRAAQIEQGFYGHERRQAKIRADLKALDKPVSPRIERKSLDELRARHSYWLGPERNERLREQDMRDRPAARRPSAFRSLAEIAQECGVTQEQIDAMPNTRQPTKT